MYGITVISTQVEELLIVVTVEPLLSVLLPDKGWGDVVGKILPSHLSQSEFESWLDL